MAPTFGPNTFAAACIVTAGSLSGWHLWGQNQDLPAQSAPVQTLRESSAHLLESAAAALEPSLRALVAAPSMTTVGDFLVSAQAAWPWDAGVTLAVAALADVVLMLCSIPLLYFCCRRKRCSARVVGTQAQHASGQVDSQSQGKLLLGSELSSVPVDDKHAMEVPDSEKMPPVPTVRIGDDVQADSESGPAVQDAEACVDSKEEAPLADVQADSVSGPAVQDAEACVDSKEEGPLGHHGDSDKKELSLPKDKDADGNGSIMANGPCQQS